MNFKKHQKYLLGIASVFLITTGIANAATGGEWVVGGLLQVVGFVAGAVLYMIGVVASWGVVIGGTLVNWSLNLNSHILNDSLVNTGWVVTRDLANLGFVFVIILISFATILQMQNYAMKKLLWKLIAAALMVNFSLVIAGVFIDFSGVLTDFFLSRATNGNISLVGERFTNAMAVHRVFQQTEDEKTIKEKTAGLADNFNNFVNFIASLAFAVFFTIAAATALFSFAAMFFMRYLSLITLLILAPLAWLMWIWPETEKQWHKWWGEFFKWIWFGPAASFFFYLAISLALTFDKGGADYLQGGAPLAAVSNSGLLIQNLGKLIAQMTSVIGLMYYGLTVANSMGIAGANFGFAVAGKVKGAITGAALGAGGYAAGGALGWMRQKVASAGVSVNPATGDISRSYAQRLATWVSGTPVLRNIAPGLSQFSQEPKKAMEEYGKRTKAMDSEMLYEEMNAIDAFVDTSWSASLISEASNKKIKDKSGRTVTVLDRMQQEDPTKFAKFINSASKLGASGQILSSRLDLAKQFGTTIEKESQKIKKPETISPEALKSEEVLIHLRPSDFTRIGKSTEDSGREQRRVIRERVQEMESYIDRVNKSATTPDDDSLATSLGYPNPTDLALKFDDIVTQINSDPLYL